MSFTVLFFGTISSEHKHCSRNEYWKCFWW